MSRVKVDWNTLPTKVLKKDIVLDRFARYLRSSGLKDETVKLYLSRVGAFLVYAKSDLPGTKIAEDYRASMIDSKLSRGHINNTALAKHLAMLQTLFYGCLRSSELCRLEDNDLDLRARTLRLRETKGGRDDIVYINEECAETLRLYLKVRPQIKIGDKDLVFYTDNQNPWTNGDVHRMFMGYKAKAGITKPGAVHVFSRHTTATMMVAKGCDCRIVKEILRHKDIHTTLRYAHLSDKTRREKYEEFMNL